jgi:hypothetical protein
MDEERFLNDGAVKDVSGFVTILTTKCTTHYDDFRSKMLLVRHSFSELVERRIREFVSRGFAMPVFWVDAWKWSNTNDRDYKGYDDELEEVRS